ncbi:hypothetical protein [Streptomyces sp. KMM 9044]|uniref:hypothetical protein n=1 Tax=Streptomyces sp. KMM 9044 TaxID=2744474 RepID=UPI002151A831|nr:hypothetical protein [Streptomyces sp. KMM 9044]WAX79451.1 hypothetical protein HUV60_019055 [Streptomyces sp. KMM 9044]
MWLWQRGRHGRGLRARMRVVGARPGDTRLIVMNNKYGAPGTTPHYDVQAMIEAAVLSHSLECEVETVRGDDLRGSNGNKPEFCIGGPLGSNVRSAGHLAHSLPGVTFPPYTHPDHPPAIEAGGEFCHRDRENQGYALLAKFTAPGGSRPVILICGQSAVTHHAAAYFLRHSYRRIADAVSSTERFCLILKIPSVRTYGFQGATLERDLTDAVFAPGPWRSPRTRRVESGRTIHASTLACFSVRCHAPRNRAAHRRAPRGAPSCPIRRP